MAAPDQVNVAQKRRALELLNQHRVAEAQAIYRELLDRDPRDSAAWMMLGIIEGRDGDIAEAEKLMRSAVEAAPAGIGEPWFGLGQVLEKQQRLDEAVEAYKKALSIKPRLAEAHAALGRIYLEEWMRFADAIRHLKTAIEIDVLRTGMMIAYPLTRTKLREVYGEALRSGGYARDAMAVFQSLLSEDPDNPDLLHRVGNLHFVFSEFDEAHRCFRRGLEIDPGHLRLKTSQIRLLSLERKTDEALEMIRPLFDEATDNFDIALCFAKLCQHAGACDAAIARFETLIESARVTPREKVISCFELGRLYDAAQQYDDAFAWYRRGNDMKSGAYDRRGTHAEIDAIVAGYRRENIAHACRARNRDERSVFIVGMPRSGTSLVEQIVSSHPDVYGAGELTKVGELLREYRKGAQASPGEWLRSECAGFSVEALDRLANRYLEFIDELSSGERYVTDKLPGNFMHLGVISLAFPKARIIHCRRNPVDTCLSCYFQDFAGFHSYAYDFESLADYYRLYRRLMAHWKEAITLPILEVDYEELIDDQEAETGRMLEFLDLEWDDRCLQHHRSERITVTASRDQVSQPIYSTSVARWKHYEKHIGPLVALLDDGSDSNGHH